MKKMRLFFLMFGCFFLLLCACTQQEDLSEVAKKTTTVAVDLQISNPMATQTKAGALDETSTTTAQYCDTELPTSGYVVLSYEVNYLKADNSSAGSDPSVTKGYEYSDVDLVTNSGEGNINTLSDLFLLEFPTDATKAKVIVSDFRVYTDESKADLLFLTPKAESAYAGYVSTPVDFSEDVDMYEKQYIKMDVLCFNKEEIPEFGFTWFDFNVVTGDEICVFFNCIGNTAATYHQVFAGEFIAYWNKGTEAAPIWVEFWNGENYSKGEVPADIVPFCIPCPGNWAEVNGFKLEVHPAWNPNEYLEYVISSDEIAAFLDEGKTFPTYTPNSVTGFETVLLETANDVPFIHFTLDDCYKPDAFYSDYVLKDPDVVSWTDGTSNIYAINYQMDNGTMDKFSAVHAFRTEGMVHLAMTPDETKLIMVQESASASGKYASHGAKGVIFRYYDLYTLEEEYLEYDKSVELRDKPNIYEYNELVYVDGELYAGCKANSCLTNIVIDWKTNKFYFGDDYKLPDSSGDIFFGGGDLLAAEDCLIALTKNPTLGKTIVKFAFNPIDGSFETEEKIATSSIAVAGITGSSMVVNEDKTLITGVLTVTNAKVSGSGGQKVFYYCDPSGTPMPINPIYSGTDRNIWFDEKADQAQMEQVFMLYGGDMASPYTSMTDTYGSVNWNTFTQFFPIL